MNPRKKEKRNYDPGICSPIPIIHCSAVVVMGYINSNGVDTGSIPNIHAVTAGAPGLDGSSSSSSSSSSSPSSSSLKSIPTSPNSSNPPSCPSFIFVVSGNSE
eukprot:GHVU01220844.1.p1 GENE.GHVU01220844.1~~GHVU01220844.1.p1  ORF type:complete len:103 (+),score=9.87 GHVU01220844.1:1969-2277(+)